MKSSIRFIAALIAAILALTACGPQPAATTAPSLAATSAPEAQPTTLVELPPPPATAAPDAPTPTRHFADLPPLEPVTYGPDPQNFPENINPLTGQPVSDPSLLSLPAVLISITNFPASARPQAGLSFAPMVFEIYITEGTTRMLAAFYGQFPESLPQPEGPCPVNETPFQSNGQPVLGNRVWWDRNANGLQEADEPGVGGICVDVYDAATDQLVAATSTDANGFYGVNLPGNSAYYVTFRAPQGTTFTTPNAGNDGLDSDADPVTGKTAPFTLTGDDSSLDAGLILPPGLLTGSGDGTFVDRVGPVRSGRLPYVYIRDFFQWSCLVYASAAEELRAQLRGCKIVYGSDADDINSAFLDVTRMREIAQQNAHPNQPFNYTGNLFSDLTPGGGAAANTVSVFYSYLNQARWDYNPLSGRYARSENYPATPETFLPATDRLTGRPLEFSNIIVLLAEHTVITPTIVDINLGMGNGGYAVLFRDGQAYRIRWTTIGGDYEKQTGLQRPIRFTDDAGNPVALKPGNTWVHVMSPSASVYEKTAGAWLARFYAPPGAK